jgi:acetamidase/formamidase
MNARITLSFALLPGRKLPEPQLRTRGAIARVADCPHYATTAHGPDLHECARQAVRHMIDHLVRTHGLSREEAYILCSVAVDLKISEIVDAPNWIVSAFLPEDVLGLG